MASFETIGGGSIAADGRLIVRKVMVETGGSSATPTAPAGYQLTNKTTTNEAGGVTRSVFEYTKASISGGGGGGGAENPEFDAYGVRLELMGGTREVPIETHTKFKDLTDNQVRRVQKAVEEKEEISFIDPLQHLLFQLLSKKVEYVLAPSVVGRITEIESVLPEMGAIAKTASPPQLNAPQDTFWVCTGISARPIGDEFEVTREYTLNFSDTSLVDVYSW
jgi:hypothetical protein